MVDDSVRLVMRDMQEYEDAYQELAALLRGYDFTIPECLGVLRLVEAGLVEGMWGSQDSGDRGVGE